MYSVGDRENTGRGDVALWYDVSMGCEEPSLRASRAGEAMTRCEAERSPLIEQQSMQRSSRSFHRGLRLPCLWAPFVPAVRFVCVSELRRVMTTEAGNLRRGKGAASSDVPPA